MYPRELNISRRLKVIKIFWHGDRNPFRSAGVLFQIEAPDRPGRYFAKEEYCSLIPFRFGYDAF
jgi:hypothetical protein